VTDVVTRGLLARGPVIFQIDRRRCNGGELILVTSNATAGVPQIPHVHYVAEEGPFVSPYADGVHIRFDLPDTLNEVALAWMKGVLEDEPLAHVDPTAVRQIVPTFAGEARTPLVSDEWVRRAGRALLLRECAQNGAPLPFGEAMARLERFAEAACVRSEIAVALARAASFNAPELVYPHMRQWRTVAPVVAGIARHYAAAVNGVDASRRAPIFAAERERERMENDVRAAEAEVARTLALYEEKKTDSRAIAKAAALLEEAKAELTVANGAVARAHLDYGRRKNLWHQRQNDDDGPRAA